MSDQPERRVVLLDTPTDELLVLRGEWEEMLTWGLSKQARKSVEIKIGAVNYVLAQRNQ
jgi:hypothetical protein